MSIWIIHEGIINFLTKADINLHINSIQITTHKMLYITFFDLFNDASILRYWIFQYVDWITLFAVFWKILMSIIFHTLKIEYRIFLG